MKGGPFDFGSPFLFMSVKRLTGKLKSDTNESRLSAEFSHHCTKDDKDGRFR
jgi:hypothetical protein